MENPGAGRTAPSDPYEAQIPVEGTVLHRDKVVARKLAALMAVSAVLFTAASIAYLMGWRSDTLALTRWLTYAITPLFYFVGLTRSVLRTVVTTREVRIEQGLWGPRIPLTSIRSAAVSDTPKLAVGVELHSPAGLRGVRIDWTDEKGRERKVLVGSNDPATLLAQIERARAQVASGVRVAAQGDASAGDDAEASREGAAGEAARSERMR